MPVDKSSCNERKSTEENTCKKKTFDLDSFNRLEPKKKEETKNNRLAHQGFE